MFTHISMVIRNCKIKTLGVIQFDKHLDIWNVERSPIPYENLQKMYDEYASSGINDISDKHMTGPEFKKWRGHYNGKKKEEW